jgi:hypothetical protein
MTNGLIFAVPTDRIKPVIAELLPLADLISPLTFLGKEGGEGIIPLFY